MSARTPARLLAPLALVTVATALYVVVSRGVDSEQEAAPDAVQTTPTPKDGEKGKSKRSKPRRTYTVKPGDTPSGIAEKTGTTVDELLELNPDIDPQSLSPGTRLKLR